MTEQFGRSFSFVRGTLGSNIISYYSLTAAPASQPRAFLLGQSMCVAISIAIRYLTAVPTFVRAAFTGSICCVVMGGLGLTTPSANALALVFAYASHDDPSMGWIKIPVLLLQNSIMILLGTSINNMNSHRQYPATWTLIVWPSWPGKLVARIKNLCVFEKPTYDEAEDAKELPLYMNSQGFSSKNLPEKNNLAPQSA